MRHNNLHEKGNNMTQNPKQLQLLENLENSQTTAQELKHPYQVCP